MKSLFKICVRGQFHGGVGEHCCQREMKSLFKTCVGGGGQCDGGDR